MTAVVLAALLLLHGREAGALARVSAARAGEMGVHRMAPPEARRLAGAVLGASARHGVPPALVLAVVEVESRYDPRALSSVGCRGLTQLAPATAAQVAGWLGRPSFALERPEDNVAIGVAYLAWLVRREGSLEAGLSAYNLGPAAFRVGGRRISRYAHDVVAHFFLLTKRLTADQQAYSVNP